MYQRRTGAPTAHFSEPRLACYASLNIPLPLRVRVEAEPVAIPICTFSRSCLHTQSASFLPDFERSVFLLLHMR